jgi:transcriptional regulator with XRE-family HTH domain
MDLNPDDERMTPREVLARHVRRLREESGLSVRGLADRLRYGYSYLSRVENGTQPPSEALVSALDEFYGTGDLFADLLKAEEDAAVPEHKKVMRKEKEAVRIQNLNSTVIPGLLQTEEYARELIRAGQSWETEAELEGWVMDRMRRQRLFKREVPPHYWVLMDEAALARPIAGPARMTRQLRHLLKASESVYNIVQVVPFACGASSNPGGTATLLTMSDGTIIGHVEGILTGEPITAQRRVIKLTRRFDQARSQALSEEDSRDLIQRYLEDYEHAD